MTKMRSVAVAAVVAAAIAGTAATPPIASASASEFTKCYHAEYVGWFIKLTGITGLPESSNEAAKGVAWQKCKRFL